MKSEKFHQISSKCFNAQGFPNQQLQIMIESTCQCQTMSEKDTQKCETGL